MRSSLINIFFLKRTFKGTKGKNSEKLASGNSFSTLLHDLELPLENKNKHNLVLFIVILVMFSVFLF